ncbi:MAG: LptF/LptG family permease [Synergistaceae bacterium]|nr:LptF/LptG family permease [Synergistaceae bacterium]
MKSFNFSNLKMRALDRFILNELKGPFFFGIVAFTIILVAGGLLFQMADLIIQKGVSIGVVMRLFLYYMPRLVVFTIPMSCLLAALLGFGKLSSNSEIVALKSVGLSFQRIVRPVVAAAFFVSICAIFINESLVPVSERAAANVMKYEVLRESAPIFTSKVFLKEESGGSIKRVIYIDRMDNATKEMSDVVVEEFEEGRLARVTTARSGRWISGSWWLEDGAVYEIKDPGKEVALLFKFNRQALTLNMNPDEISSSSASPDEMTIPELLAAIRLRGKTGEPDGELWMALHLRLSVPWACLVFAILGAALGSRPQRSSSGVGLGFSVIIIFVYYVIMSFSRALGESGALPPPVAAWTANLVFLSIGLYLCSRANRLG